MEPANITPPLYALRMRQQLPNVPLGVNPVRSRMSAAWRALENRVYRLARQPLLPSKRQRFQPNDSCVDRWYLGRIFHSAQPAPAHTNEREDPGEPTTWATLARA